MTAQDFREVVLSASVDDLVYLDPPYQGTFKKRDSRYYGGVEHRELVDVLEWMNDRDISYIVSYDGWTGNRQHGVLSPDSLALRHIKINAGRPTQSTTLGNCELTADSLYLSQALVKKLERRVVPLLI